MTSIMHGRFPEGGGLYTDGENHGFCLDALGRFGVPFEDWKFNADQARMKKAWPPLRPFIGRHYATQR